LAAAVFGLVVPGPHVTPVPAADASAEAILDATGVDGGLIVHLGCGDGRLTAALHADPAYLVHGLDADATDVAAARRRISEAGLYGSVSIDRLCGPVLPYVDNLVNLVVVEAPETAGVTMAEIKRVLRPGGVAYVKRDGDWSQVIKPVPDTVDEWSHYLHSATNNAVANDTVVGPARHLQWVGSSRWTRHHDHMSSFTALVSAGGRLFYIIDEGPRSHIQLPAQWSLVARDAYNGVVLWKRRIDNWHTHLWFLKSGPATLPRRLVAVGDRVYMATIDGRLVCLDAP